MTSSTQIEELKKRAYDYFVSDEDFPLIREDDPCVIKKMERMKEILERAPFPEEFLPKNRSNL
ncbi:MAG TPA: hypothetical protein VGM41_21075 [Chitinophagaceae bacterium]|jgi:hypothetical protein